MTRLEGNQLLAAGQLDYGRTELSVGYGTSAVGYAREASGVDATRILNDGRRGVSERAPELTVIRCMPRMFARDIIGWGGGEKRDQASLLSDYETRGFIASFNRRKGSFHI
ncbi:MAG: hypothetical protein V3S73_08595 [Gammaproteobacteria bacterium]